MRQPGSNTIEVTDNIKRMLPVSRRRCRRPYTWDSWRPLQEYPRGVNDIQFTMAAHWRWSSW